MGKLKGTHMIRFKLTDTESRIFQKIADSEGFNYYSEVLKYILDKYNEIYFNGEIK